MSESPIGWFFSDLNFGPLIGYFLFTVYFCPDYAGCALIPKFGYFGRKNIFFIFGNIFGFQFLVIRRICWVKYNGIQNCFENGDLQASKSHSLLAEEYVEYSVAILVSRKLLKTRRQKMARWGHHGAGLGLLMWRPGVIKWKGIPCTIMGGWFWGLPKCGNAGSSPWADRRKKGGATRRCGAPILGALESPVGSRLAHRVDAVHPPLIVWQFLSKKCWAITNLKEPSQLPWVQVHYKKERH